MTEISQNNKLPGKCTALGYF